MFKPVPSKPRIPQMEEALQRTWKIRRIYQKLDDKRRGGQVYVSYESAPDASGLPGVTDIQVRAFQDLFHRYRSMRGFHVVRRVGWNTHGLPIEIQVEKRLGISSKRQIEEYGIARFNAECRRSAIEHLQDWEKWTERIGYWADLEDAYVTSTNEYIESEWWILKNFWDRGLLTQSFKVIPYCPRCGTSLSDYEVSLGYGEAVDPSVFVRLPLTEDPGTSLLIWTDSPWTLPGNVAVAADPETEYVIVERRLPEGGVEKLILAESLVARVFQDEPVEKFETFKGRKLRGLRYRPLFTFLVPEKPAYRVLLDDLAPMKEGTGLVHIAPAFGAQDMRLALEYDLPILETVAEDGTFIPEVRPWSGLFVKQADPLIIQDLAARGLLYREAAYSHATPYCWQCSTPLIHYARSAWYLRTTRYREQLAAANLRIQWRPERVRLERFGSWLSNTPDWTLGRERYWGTPLPVWECEVCHHQLAVGSVVDLSQLSGEDLGELDLHRPFVDEVRIACPECHGEMSRVPEVVDACFDLGAMPVAQWHYPFENNEIINKLFPADFVCESTEQTKGWFYSLHAIGTLLFEQESFRNAICLGKFREGEGPRIAEPQTSRFDPWEVIHAHGSDALRWYLYTAGPPDRERRISKELIGEVVRNFSLRLWNVYSFFVTHANLAGWRPPIPSVPFPSSWRRAGSEEEDWRHEFDRWLLSELHTLVRDVTAAMESYDVTGATRPIQDFVADLSNWYLRRSRRRFRENGSGDDKEAAFSTLYQTLTILSRLLAPTVPFLAEELYQNLVCAVDPGAPESVHLADWPAADETLIDETLNAEMRLVRRLACLGHAARAKAGIKVRQPLPAIAYSVGSSREARAVESFAGLLAEELNVKRVEVLGPAGEGSAWRLDPIPGKLGKKYRGKYPQVRAAVLSLDAEEAAQSLLDGKPIEVNVGGEVLEVLPEEIAVRVEPGAGLVVVSKGVHLAALRTELTPELRREGSARDLVRRIQDLRKLAGFNLGDRIRLQIAASPGLEEAIREHREVILRETLAVELESGGLPEGVRARKIQFDNEEGWVNILPSA